MKTPETLTIHLPLPMPELSPNARCHWATKAKITKAYSQWAWAKSLKAIGNAAPPRWKDATVECHFYFADRRHRDRDNAMASLKPAFDGLADAGVVCNDSGLTQLPAIMDVDRVNPRVELLVVPT